MILIAEFWGLKIESQTPVRFPTPAIAEAGRQIRSPI